MSRIAGTFKSSNPRSRADTPSTLGYSWHAELLLAGNSKKALFGYVL